MKKKSNKEITTVGEIDADVLTFTVGEDLQLDLNLVEADCLGSAAHVTMLSRLPISPRLFSRAEVGQVVAELVRIIRDARNARFSITRQDQDVHLAVERRLTGKLGNLGKKIHTARSRNDQVAVDLRLFAKPELQQAVMQVAGLADALLKFAGRHRNEPMAGRTHLQPAMPSSVGVWASAHAESLLDDVAALRQAYELNDQCPLGSAAGYGVPLPIDRALVSELLGFARPCHNVLYASQARGKVESVILSALSQVMVTLSRLAQDLMLFSMPEFSYFTLPASLCTGSSIMPQKKNPDVLELIRAKASKVIAHQVCVLEIIKGLPGGYNRDLQETKGPLMDGLAITRSCVSLMTKLVGDLKVNRDALRAGFTPEVFAADRVLELVGQGIPFRDAYHQVKNNLDELKTVDPAKALAKKTHLGAPAGLDLGGLGKRAEQSRNWAEIERRKHARVVSKLLGMPYPALG